jgi:hypothetical protein
MAYDLDLANRIRELLAPEPGLTEKKMFGGVAFLINGHIAITVSSQGGVMVRGQPARSGSLSDAGAARPVIMRGRPLGGWVRVAPDHVRSRSQLAKWVQLGSSCARAQPAKR